MKRKIYQTLLNWKNDTENIKPLMILGARQVGKTYIIDEFCKKEFKNYIHINLFENQDIIALYKEKINSEKKLQQLKIILNFDIEQEDTVVFIDEIQESEELIAELKYFCEKHNKIRIITAGSLLGIKLKRSSFSFPVGKVWMHTMYPMDFEEFLTAIGQDNLAQIIKEGYDNNKALSDTMHRMAMDYYRCYLITGGMPESVSNFIENNLDISKYNTLVLDNIRDSYFKDMSKYVTSKSESLKIEATYQSIPSQLANQSHKFQFSKIDSNAKSRDYELPLDWLKASDIVKECFQVTTPETPLKGFEKIDFFKLFLNDVGILVNALKINMKSIIRDELSLYKGILAENYVANQFTANNIPLYYWVSSATAEVDFLLDTEDDGIIPVEVKAGDNTKSKSLAQYIEKYNPKYAIRISSKNFGFVNNIKSIPLYAVFCIKNR